MSKKAAPIQNRVKEHRLVKASELLAHPLNFRRHPERQKKLLAQNLQEIGHARSLTAYETPQGLRLIDGHLRADMDPHAMLPVEILDVTEQEANQLLLTLDPLAGLAETDSKVLEELLAATPATGELEAFLKEQATNAGLLLDTPSTDEPDEIPPDRYAEVLQKWPVKAGEIWQLGKHRLLCGDSLDEASYPRLLGGTLPALVIADPPYGVSIVRKPNRFGRPKAFGGKTGTIKGKGVVTKTTHSDIIGDDSTATAIDSASLCLSLFPNASQCWWGANYYASALPDSMCWLVWDKDTNGNFADCELAWVNQNKAARLFHHRWSGMIRDSEREKRWHPTQKPAALASWVYSLFLKESSVVLDPFGGGGWSLLAAEQSNHSAYVIEMSPEYCAVTCERWHAMTKQTPTLYQNE